MDYSLLIRVTNSFGVSISIFEKANHFFAQVFDGCSNVINIVVNTKETVMR